MESLTSGLGIILLAALFQGSFVVPMAYARSWKWENSWLVFSILGMLVFNGVFAWSTVSGLASVYSEATPVQLLIPIVFGALWGIGAICFGLGMAAVGLALGYAIIMGLVLSMGAFLPMICLHPADVFTAKGQVVMFGFVVMLFGILMSGLAGKLKETEQGTRAGEITKTTDISLGVGLLICIVAGIFSSLNNVGYALSEPLIKLAESQGTSPFWAGNAVWLLIFSSGGVVNITYSLVLLKRRKTFGLYKNPDILKNMGLVAAMALMWIGSFVLYGLGASKMGNWGTVIGWSVFIAISIALGNVWGIMQGEWKGTKPKSRRIMGISMAIQVLAILIFAWGAQL